MSWVKMMSCEKNLHAVYTEARPCVKFLVANVALEVLRLLMLDQNLLIVKLPIAVPTCLILNVINCKSVRENDSVRRESSSP